MSYRGPIRLPHPHSSFESLVPWTTATGEALARGRYGRAVVVCATCIATALGCGRKEAVIAPPSPGVLTETVHARPPAALTRRGVAVAGARLRLGFNAPGVIAAITVTTGDTVRRGQLLASLKHTDATAAMHAAKATRVRALRDYKAADSLATSGALATQQRDDAQSYLDVADANLTVATESLGLRKLAAPIAGTVLQRLAEPGEAVAPGMPVLVLEDTQRLVVRLGINERELARVRPGQSASLVAGDGDPPVPATVSRIAPAPGADGLYAVELSPVSTHAATLRPGTLLTVRFEERAKELAVHVPIDALVHREEKTWVFVVAGAEAAATTRIRELKVGRADGKEVQVLTGLADGDRIIREGAQFLLDGQTVRLLD